MSILESLEWCPASSMAEKSFAQRELGALFAEPSDGVVPGHRSPSLLGSSCFIHFGANGRSRRSGEGLAGCCSAATGGEWEPRSCGGFCAHHRGRIRLGEEFVYQKAKISTCLAEAGLVSCRKAIPSKWKRTNSKVGDRRHGGCG